jgi:site-specific recombinase XerD
MRKTNPANERIKREYLRYLTEARGRDEATIDGVAKSLARFELSTRARDFKRFHREQAVAFKTRLADAANARTGERLSKATVMTAMRHLREFFFWLAHQPGFKSHIAYTDADYFNLSDKDMAVARARREKRVPTVDQARHLLASMPAATAIERRDRAVIAFATVTGARVGALASFRLGHVDLAGGFVEQDAREVRTKAAKTFRTYFMPVDEGAPGIVTDWVQELQRDHREPRPPSYARIWYGAPGTTCSAARMRALIRRRITWLVTPSFVAASLMVSQAPFFSAER